MSKDKAGKADSILGAADTLHGLLELIVHVEDVDLETVAVLLVHLIEPLLDLGEEVVALEMNVGETVGTEGGEESGSGGLEEKLLERDGGAAGDENVASHLVVVVVGGLVSAVGVVSEIVALTVLVPEVAGQLTGSLTHLELTLLLYLHEGFVFE